ncbi:MAG: CoA pyrophosphatase [Balneolaceae bacterium]
MISTPFISWLKQRLKEKPLPGRDAQHRMAPDPMGEGEPDRGGCPEEGACCNGVMVLLIEEVPGHPEVLLTLRADTISHAGQISFPGGRMEAGETITETALREMREETGIREDFVDIAGSLTGLLLAYSSNHIQPVIGSLSARPTLKLNPEEVKEAFFTPIQSLFDEKLIRIEPWTLRNLNYRVPYWNIHQVPLWGATAMILSELMELYREHHQMELPAAFKKRS